MKLPRLSRAERIFSVILFAVAFLMFNMTLTRQRQAAAGPVTNWPCVPEQAWGDGNDNGVNQATVRIGYHCDDVGGWGCYTWVVRYIYKWNGTRWVKWGEPDWGTFDMGADCDQNAFNSWLVHYQYLQPRHRFKIRMELWTPINQKIKTIDHEVVVP